jgi:hypothetical protein
MGNQSKNHFHVLSPLFVGALISIVPDSCLLWNCVQMISERPSARLLSFPQNLVRPGRLASCAGWASALPMIRFYRNAGRITVPAEHWFGSALHRSINWPCSDAAGRGAGAPCGSAASFTISNRLRQFSSHQSAVLGVYVVVVAGLARRTESHSTRNGPALAPSRRRFDLEISITWSLGRSAPRDRSRDSPTDPRELSASSPNGSEFPAILPSASAASLEPARSSG